MKQIEIQYYPFPLLRWQRTVTGTDPETWDDVTARQLIAIVSTWNETIGPLRFLSVMTGIPQRVLKKIDSFHRYNINNLLGFMSEIKPHNTFILNKITISGMHFFAPLPKLKKMSFGQFIFADTHFGNYQEKHEPEEAARFLAALYLPANCKFSEDIIDKNLTVFSRADAVTIEAVTINYLLIKEWLSKTYPLVFQTDETRNPEPGTRNPLPRDPMAWVKILESLVGDDLIHQNDWADMPVHNIFRYMSQKIKQNMKRK